MDENEILKKLTLEEKANLLVGHTNMTTYPIEEKGIPSFTMSDGPHGVRKENSGETMVSNIHKNSPATCFPCLSTLSNTWDTELMYRVGKQIAFECRYYGVNAILGPAINIKRNPLCGRNFEYVSEDPILAGYLAASYVKGLQEEKVLACLKHYACNNLEKWRYVGDSVVDLRALNDIYLKPFEIVVRESKPGMVMTSYNQINGTFASENEYLIQDRLRNKMGFDGFTVTDWGGMVNRDISLNRGQDLEMPGMVKQNVQKIIDGVNFGLIKEETLDQAVLRLLRAISLTRVDKFEDKELFLKSERVALEAALKGAVLLKNNNNILPLNRNEEYVIIGDLFKNMRFQGSGSSLINPKYLIDNKDAFDTYNVRYQYAQGYRQDNPKVDRKLEKEALELAKGADTILFFGGLTDLSESEGYDRENMLLDENQIHLLEELSKLHKKMVFVMYGGSPFEVPCYGNIDGMLFMCLPGECGGEALRELLFGEVSPSGHLGETWPMYYEDVPYSDEFNKTPNELYKESVFVGYRYFNTAKKEVRFPFGYGLTYGQYSLSNLEVKQDDKYIHVTFEVANESKIHLSAVAQLYVGMKNSVLPRPNKELKGYVRINLKPREKQIVATKIKIADLAVYDTKSGKDYVEEGEYVIYLSEHVEKDADSKTIFIPGVELEKNEKYNIYSDINNITKISKEQFENVIGRKIIDYKVKRPYTFETPLIMYKSLFGRIVVKAVLGIGNKMIKKAKNIQDEKEKQQQIKVGYFIKKALQVNCLRSMWFSSGGVLTYNKAMGILNLSNGKLIKGIKYLKKK